MGGRVEEAAPYVGCGVGTALGRMSARKDRALVYLSSTIQPGCGHMCGPGCGVGAGCSAGAALGVL